MSFYRSLILVDSLLIANHSWVILSVPLVISSQGIYLGGVLFGISSAKVYLSVSVMQLLMLNLLSNRCISLDSYCCQIVLVFTMFHMNKTSL